MHTVTAVQDNVIGTAAKGHKCCQRKERGLSSE